MLVAFAIGLTRPIGAAQLALVAAVWCLVDQPFEGANLIHLSDAHSVTTGDIPGVLGFACAIALGWWHLRRRG